MYDGFKVRLPPTMIDVLLKNELLAFKSFFDNSTGEVEGYKFAHYPNEINTSGKNSKLCFKIKGTYVELTGSLHKFWQNGTNYKTYQYMDVVQTLKKLHTLFQINLNEATIHNLEFGLNISLEALLQKMY